MNNVELNPNSICEENLKIGDLFVDPKMEVYILSETNTQEYQAICLNDGTYWKEPLVDIQEATDGLDFYGRDCKMQIYRKNESDEDRPKFEPEMISEDKEKEITKDLKKNRKDK